jgi:restriction system protein
MAEITQRRKGELVRGVFKILIDNPDGLKAKNVLKELVSIVPPTEFESTFYPDKPNVRRYEKIVRFSTISPVKAGWIMKEKGQWTITEEGIKAYEKHTDPEMFYLEAFRLYKQWKQEQPPSDEDEEESSGDDTATTLEEAEEVAWSEIEKHLT